nr:MAG TPA_asm: hypothetical protein [Caudoviricetes sp.]
MCKEQTTKAKKSYLCASVYRVSTNFELKTRRK